MIAESQHMVQHDKADTMALEYANIHQLDELVDSLICKVVEKKPENAKSFMANYLKTRLRNAKKHNNAENKETAFMKLEYSSESHKSSTATAARATSSSITSSPILYNANSSREASILSTETESLRSNNGSVKSMPVERVLHKTEIDRRKTLGCNGVWQHLTNSAISLIMIQVKELATEENVIEQLPPQFIATLSNVIEVLAKASECVPESVFISMSKANAIEFSKKLDRCLEELRLPPHQQMPKAFELLKEIILYNTPLATYSQQQHLNSLINYVCHQVQKGRCVQIENLFCDVWRTIRANAIHWNEIVQYSCGEMFIFDPLLILDANALKMCVYLLDELADVLPNWEQAHTCICDTLYNFESKKYEVKIGSFYENLERSFTEYSLCNTSNFVSCEIADKFVVYSTLLIRCIEETVGAKNFTTAHSCAFYGVIKRIACIICDVIKSQGRECVNTPLTSAEDNTSDYSLFDYLIATCRSFFGKRCALMIARRSKREAACVDDSSEVMESFASYLHSHLPSLEKVNVTCHVFVSVASTIIAHPFDGSSSSRLESVFMNARVLLSTLLLRLCIVIIELRNVITLSEVRKFSGRFLFYGIPISDMYMFFQRTFTIAFDNLSKKTNENGKEYRLSLEMLKLLEGAFANTNLTSYLRKAQKSLELLQKEAKFDELSASYLTHAYCESNVPPSTVAQSICFQELLNGVIQTLTNEQSENLMCENVVKLHTLLSARLLMCRYKPQKFWSIITTVLLANCNIIHQKLATFSLLLPAIQIIGALNPTVGVGAELKNSAQDRFMLLSFFQSCKLPRAIHWSMENFICTFPSYRARILHHYFAYEYVETELSNFILTLFRSTQEEVEVMLQYWSNKMAVYGVKKQDLILFGIALTSQLRRSNFPEFEWVLFYNGIIDELEEKATSTLKLSNYTTKNDLIKIKCAQSIVRRFLKHRKANALFHTNYSLLQKRLQELSTQSGSERKFSKNEQELKRSTSMLLNNEQSRDNFFTIEKRYLVQLSWRSLKLDAQMLTLYKAIVSANTFDLNTHSLNHDMFDLSYMKFYTQPVYEHSSMYIFTQEGENTRTSTDVASANKDVNGENNIKNYSGTYTSATSREHTNANDKWNNYKNNSSKSSNNKYINCNINNNNKNDNHNNINNSNNINKISNESERKEINTTAGVVDKNRCINEDNQSIPAEARLTNRQASHSALSSESSMFSSPSSLRRSRQAQRNLMAKCEVIAKNMETLVELLLEERWDTEQKENKEYVYESQMDINQDSPRDCNNTSFSSLLSASTESSRINNVNIPNL